MFTSEMQKRLTTLRLHRPAEGSARAVPGWERAHGGLAGRATPLSSKHGSSLLQFLFKTALRRSEAAARQLLQGSPERGLRS